MPHSKMVTYLYLAHSRVVSQTCLAFGQTKAKKKAAQTNNATDDTSDGDDSNEQDDADSSAEDMTLEEGGVPSDKGDDESDDEVPAPKKKRNDSDKSGRSRHKYMAPSEVLDHIKKLYAAEEQIMRLAFGSIRLSKSTVPDTEWTIGGSSPISCNYYTDIPAHRAADPMVYFLEVVAVPPSRFRPLNMYIPLNAAHHQIWQIHSSD